MVSNICNGNSVGKDGGSGSGMNGRVWWCGVGKVMVVGVEILTTEWVATMMVITVVVVDIAEVVRVLAIAMVVGQVVEVVKMTIVTMTVVVRVLVVALVVVLIGGCDCFVSQERVYGENIIEPIENVISVKPQINFCWWVLNIKLGMGFRCCRLSLETVEACCFLFFFFFCCICEIFCCLFLFFHLHFFFENYFYYYFSIQVIQKVRPIVATCTFNKKN